MQSSRLCSIKDDFKAFMRTIKYQRKVGGCTLIFGHISASVPSHDHYTPVLVKNRVHFAHCVAFCQVPSMRDTKFACFLGFILSTLLYGWLSPFGCAILPDQKRFSSLRLNRPTAGALSHVAWYLIYLYQQRPLLFTNMFSSTMSLY